MKYYLLMKNQLINILMSLFNHNDTFNPVRPYYYGIITYFKRFKIKCQNIN